MDNFFIHFVLCNITIGLFVLILLCMKRIFKHCLTPRMQFNLWIPFTISNSSDCLTTPSAARQAEHSSAQRP